MSHDLNNITVGEILYLLKDLALTDERKLEIKQAVEDGDVDGVSKHVNNFLNSLIETNGGVAGLAQVIFKNALDRDVSETFVQQVVADFLRQGVDSWWELFHTIISEDDSEFGNELNQRISENAPKFESAIPEDESIEVLREANIELKFNKAIQVGAGGNIELRIVELDVGTTIPVENSQISITGDTVTINPENDLSPNAHYAVLIDPGAFVDTEFFIPFEGIIDSDVLDFATIGFTIPRSAVSYNENQIAGYIIKTINEVNNSELTNFEIVTDNGSDYFNNENGYFAIDEAKRVILTEAGVASALNDFEILPNEVTLGIMATDADGNTRVVEEIDLIVEDAIDFTFTADDSVVEGLPLTYTVTTSEPVAEDTEVIFTVLPGNSQAPDQGTNTTNLNDFPAGTFNPLSVTIPAGQTTATFDVTGLIDDIVELPETYAVSAVVGHQTLTRTTNLLDAQPALVLDKQVVSIDAAGDGVLNAAGEVIDYRLVVSNTGNLALTNIVVTDPLTGLNTVIESLAPGVQDFATRYTLTQADIDNRGGGDDDIDNTAFADSDQTDPVADTELVPLVIPQLVLDKQVVSVDAAGDGVLNAAGDIIDYNILVSNAGNMVLTNIVVIDPLTNMSEVIDILAPGGVQNFATSYTLTQADIDSNGTVQDEIAGFIDNTAFADSDQTEPVADTEQVPIERLLLVIDKQVTGVDVAGDGVLNAAGDIINYNIVVSNTGNTTLTNVEVFDPLTADAIEVGDLAPGSVQNIPTSYTLTQADFDNRGGGDDAIDNTAIAESDQTLPVSDTEQVPLVIVPRLVLDKQVVSIDAAGDGILNAVGEVIDYRLVVSNTGNQALTNVRVQDPLTGFNTVIESLAPGSVQDFATNYTLTQADIDSNGTVQDEIAGFIDNTAFADSDQTEPVADTEQVPIERLLLVIDKQVTGVDVAGDGVLNAAGDIINYNIVVSNTGNTTLTNVEVFDPLTADAIEVGDLAPGSVQNIPTSYTLTQADFDNRGGGDDAIDNTAIAESDQTLPVSDTEQVPLVIVPRLVLDKQVVSIDAAGDGILNAVGEVIDYRLVVSNTGNQALTNVRVQDPLTGFNTVIESLAPGSVQDFATNYTLTQADIDSNGTVQDEIAGFIDNTAFADSDQTDPVADTEQVPLVIQRLVLNKQVVDVDAAGDGILNAAGDIIDYNILVSNAGNMVLTNIVVIDPLTNMSEVIDILAPGGVQNFATSYTLTQADIDSNGTVQDEIAGFIDNTAFADSDQTDPAADTEQVPLVIPQLVLDKQVVSIDAAGDGVLNAAGEVIDYRLVVSNTGNLALTNIVVTDPLTGLNTVIGSLAPEGVQNIPTSYTLTQADIDSNGTVEDSIAGFIDNTATADSDQTVPVSDTVQVPIPRSFVLTAEADSVAEGTALTFTVTASAPVAQDTDVVFTVMPGNSQAADQGTGTTNLSDFVAGTFNPVTVTIPEGGTSATYDVTGIDDGLVESPESYTVQAVVADQTLTQSTNLLDRSNISLTQLYIGFFDAAPGKANLTAFEDVVDSGVTIAQIADYLADHPLFANIMATATTSAEQAEILMGHLGLTPDGVDGSPASQFAEFITASIDSGMGFGSIIYNIVDFLSQGDTLSFEFVEIAELLNNKELVADIYSRNNSSSSLSELQSVLDGVTSRSPSTEAEALAFLQNKGVDTTAQTISLTTNQDNVIGTADNDIFLGPVAITGHPLGNLREETLQSFDIIDGGEGIDTALLEIGATDAVTINPAIANVENLDITSLSADTLDMSQIIGATNVNSISSIDALSLNNVGNIIGLGLRNTNSVTTVNYTDDALSGSNDFMSLNLENAGGVIGINNPSPMTFSVDVLNISSSGLRNNVTLSGEALIATHTINISGPSDLNLTYTVPTAVPDIFRVDARTSAGVSSGNHVLDFSQQSEETFVFGGFGSEIISTGSFGDTIFAGAGDDTIFGNFGDDLITGGSGNDTINGQEGADSLNGDTGDDIINGGSGNDSITGGFGADELDGGDGNDTFIFGAGDSLNTSLDRINNIGIGDILDFDLAIDPLNGTDLTFLGFSASSGITSTSLADDIRNAVINNDNAFDNSGDTVYLRLNGNSIAGSDAWYIVQRGHDDDIFTYDAGSDTVIALVGYPPTVPDGFFATLDIVDGNLQVAQELLPPAG